MPCCVAEYALWCNGAEREFTYRAFSLIQMLTFLEMDDDGENAAGF